MLVQITADVMGIIEEAEFARDHARQVLGAFGMMEHPKGGGSGYAPMPAWLQINAGGDLMKNEDKLYLLGEEIAGRSIHLLAERDVFKSTVGKLAAQRCTRQAAFGEAEIAAVERAAQSILNVAKGLNDRLTTLTSDILRY
jgi:hypothetical protein